MKLLDNSLIETNSVIFLHAHPDDESFLNAGLINQFVIEGKEVVVIYLAAGLVNGESKTITRQFEAINACNKIGVKDVFFLNFLDRKYDDNNDAFVLQEIDDVCLEIVEHLSDLTSQNTCTLFSYDENGGYGHSDHLYLHKVGRNLIHKNKSIFKHLYEVTINRTLISDWLISVKNKLSENLLPKLNYWSENFGLTEDEISYFYNLSENQIRLKKDALMCHPTQINKQEFPLSLPQDDFRKLFGVEYYKKVSTE